MIVIDTRPGIGGVLEILKMKRQAAELYDEIDRRMKKICDEFGEGRYDYDLVRPDGDGKRYLKFEVTDNIRKMKDGEDIWKSVSIKPVVFSLGMLKNCPKSLK